MKNLLTKIIDAVKKHPVRYSVVLVVVLIVIFYFSRNTSKTEKLTIAKGTIIETVQASGKTKSAEDVSLGFNKGGRVSRVYVKVGDSVRAGQTLVVLDQAELRANLLKAQADLASETAKLDELKQANGSNQVNQGGNSSNNSNAEIAYADSKANLISKIKDSFTKSDDAVRNYSDQFFTGVSPSISFRDSFQSSGTTIFLNIDPNLRLSLVGKRTELGSTLSSWASSIAKLGTDSDLVSYMSEAKENLEFVRNFLDNLSLAVNNFNIPNSEFASTIAQYKADVSTARTNINTAITNLLAAQEKYNNANLDINVSTQTISAQENKVQSSKADVQAIEAKLAELIIFAPFDGIVTSSKLDPGEIVGAGVNAISLISQKKLQIESNVSEVNIGKVNIGNPVVITLDAFPSQKFSGKVTYIEPAETIVDNVVTYKVTVIFDEDNENLKSGLTSNLNIETARKENVVVIPEFGVTNREGKSYVQKLVNGRSVETEVKLGDRSSDGMVEVVSGISEGDTVEVASKS